MTECREKRKKSAVTNKREKYLLNERNDVSVILHIIEQDKTISPPLWQVESLKHSLQILDQEIHSFKMLSERQLYGRNKQTLH